MFSIKGCCWLKKIVLSSCETNSSFQSVDALTKIKQRRSSLCARSGGSTITIGPFRTLFEFLKNKETKVLFYCCPHVKHINLIWVYFRFFFFFFFEWPLFIDPLRLKAAMASVVDSSSMGLGLTSFNGPTVSSAWTGLNEFISTTNRKQKGNFEKKKRTKLAAETKILPRAPCLQFLLPV